MRTRLCRLAALATVIASLTLLAITATPAAATEAAVLERSQYIAGYPAPGAKSCQHRTISLAAGSYLWYQVYWGYGSDPVTRNIYLTAGTYSWETCVTGYYPYAVYQQVSTLSLAGHATASITGDFGTDGVNGTYLWGDVLSPQF